MEKLLYVMLLEKTNTYKRMNKAAVVRHVDNIRELDDEGELELCGVLRKPMNSVNASRLSLRDM